MMKLIRDFITPDKGEVFVATSDAQYKELLYSKLLEESAELAKDRNIEEAADVLEVLSAIWNLEGWAFSDILDVAVEKGHVRGIFDRRHVWKIKDSEL